MSQDVPQNSITLSDSQVQALPYMTSSRTFSEAAEKAGISRRTINRWMNDPAFREEYQRHRDEAGAIARAAIRGLMLDAVSVIAERLDSDDPKERVRAAKTILSFDTKTAAVDSNRKVVNHINRIMAQIAEEAQNTRMPPTTYTDGRPAGRHHR